MNTAATPPPDWLALTFVYSNQDHRDRLSAAIDHAGTVARKARRYVNTSGHAPKQRLWNALRSIDRSLPELARTVELASISNLLHVSYSPQPSYHQAGFLIGAILFPRIAVAWNPTWERVSCEPEVGDDETLVLHPEYHLVDERGQLLYRIDTRLSTQTRSRTICELYDECDPSSTHTRRYAAAHRSRREELAAIGIVPGSTDNRWLQQLGPRWEHLYTELKKRRNSALIANDDGGLRSGNAR